MEAETRAGLEELFSDEILGINRVTERLRIYIIVLDVLRVKEEDSFWEFSHAILDHDGGSSIEKKVGPFPGHTERGKRGHAVWKDNFNRAYNVLSVVSPDDFLAFCRIEPDERAAVLNNENITEAFIKLYRKLHHREKRKQPVQYRFSKEIFLYYTVSKLTTENTHRITIYPKDENSRQIKSGTIQVRLKDLSHLADTIEKRIVTHKKLREAVIGSIPPQIHSSLEISLKSYWYIHTERLASIRGYKQDTEKLFTSGGAGSKIGDCIISEAQVSDYQNAMKYLLRHSPHYKTDEEQALAWRCLIFIISEAYRHSVQSRDNTSVLLKKVLAALREADSRNDTRIQAVRNALVKKTLLPDEERAVYQNTLEALDRAYGKAQADGRMRWDYLGVLIRMFTGLSPGEVCALTWGDYCSKRSPAVHYFTVSKHLEAKSNQPEAFSKREQYRLVPVTSLLKKALDRGRAEAENILSQRRPKAPLEEQPIIADYNDLTIPCKPKKLRETTQKILKKCIPDVQMVQEFDAWGRYRGDIMRSNFRYRALNTCGMSLGETQYLLGNQAPDTFSRHYCDFTNQFAQFALSTKLERWVCQLQDFMDLPQSLPINLGKSHTAHPFNAEKMAVHIQFDIPKLKPEACGNISISIKSRCGVEATAVLARRVEKSG
ncbi:hypothetical protein LJC64_05190 [Ruminococcaceae bacterium OttesenSCG-928-A11]|nr:hypothetical protein [Ruminococcaceae bacterium OttesenSCG-928-A11]